MSNTKDDLLIRKCKECGKSLPKLHIGDICIVCEAEAERMDSDKEEETFVRFKKQKKGFN